MRRRAALAAVVVLALAAAVAVWLVRGRGGGGESEAVDSSGGPAPAAVACEARPRPEQQRGACFAHTWQDGGAGGYGSATAAASLDELVDIGLTWISITPFGYQPSLASTEVRFTQMPASETDARLRATIGAAHARGLRVTLKPHLWISYDEWVGHLAPRGPDGWARWFESYERFIMHYARLAEDAGADMFVVGVELDSSALAEPERWRALIGRVRTVYSGPLVYAANWDAAERITFWDAVDYMGVQMFAPLADHPDPSPAQLRAAAQAYLETYGAVAARYGRPLLLTEVGYKSVDGAAVAPWTWPEHLPALGTVIDQRDQAEAYCAILEVFGAAENVAGMYWWKWFTDPDSGEEGPEGFSPRGKLAEDVLREAYRRAEHI